MCRRNVRSMLLTLRDHCILQSWVIEEQHLEPHLQLTVTPCPPGWQENGQDSDVHARGA
jgi:hypothetical protein